MAWSDAARAAAAEARRTRKTYILRPRMTGGMVGVRAKGGTARSAAVRANKAVALREARKMQWRSTSQTPAGLKVRNAGTRHVASLLLKRKR